MSLRPPGDALIVYATMGVGLLRLPVDSVTARPTAGGGYTYPGRRQAKRS